MIVKSFKACKHYVLFLGRNQSVFTTSQERRKIEGHKNKAKDKNVNINIGQKFAFLNPWIGFILETGFPWWTLIIIKQEYTVEKKAIIKNKGKKHLLLNNIPVIKKISLQKLLAGGTPIFIVIIKAQNKLKKGTKFIFPLESTIERDFERS